jgi:16S rRNA (guanine966-N2)-methyltransferase
MQIISGIARGINLSVPRGMGVRPTAARSRKALFDSLGNFSGLNVVDLFAGAGALGLEAASRGASFVFFVEKSAKHCSVIESNIEKVCKAGVDCDLKLVRGNALNSGLLSRFPNPDLIFADPPYAESESFFEKLLADKSFAEWGKDALLVWELPDKKGSGFAKTGLWKIDNLRKFGATQFLFCKVS